MEVLDKDKQYLIWVCENLSNTKGYEKTVELAKSYIEHELNDRATQRELEKIENDKKRKKAIQILLPIANELADNNGGFRDSVAKDMKNGYIPQGRGLSITIDILSKMRGRRGSKAYEQRYNELEQIFKSLEK